MSYMPGAASLACIHHSKIKNIRLTTLTILMQTHALLFWTLRETYLCNCQVLSEARANDEGTDLFSKIIHYIYVIIMLLYLVNII